MNLPVIKGFETRKKNLTLLILVSTLSIYWRYSLVCNSWDFRVLIFKIARKSVSGSTC